MKRFLREVVEDKVSDFYLFTGEEYGLMKMYLDQLGYKYELNPTLEPSLFENNKRVYSFYNNQSLGLIKSFCGAGNKLILICDKPPKELKAYVAEFNLLSEKELRAYLDKHKGDYNISYAGEKTINELNRKIEYYKVINKAVIVEQEKKAFEVGDLFKAYYQTKNEYYINIVYKLFSGDINPTHAQLLYHVGKLIDKENCK